MRDRLTSAPEDEENEEKGTQNDPAALILEQVMKQFRLLSISVLSN